jgi:hypothetical protein
MPANNLCCAKYVARLETQPGTIYPHWPTQFSPDAPALVFKEINNYLSKLRVAK